MRSRWCRRVSASRLSQVRVRSFSWEAWCERRSRTRRWRPMICATRVGATSAKEITSSSAPRRSSSSASRSSGASRWCWWSSGVPGWWASRRCSLSLRMRRGAGRGVIPSATSSSRCRGPGAMRSVGLCGFFLPRWDHPTPRTLPPGCATPRPGPARSPG